MIDPLHLANLLLFVANTVSMCYVVVIRGALSCSSAIHKILCLKVLGKSIHCPRIDCMSSYRLHVLVYYAVYTRTYSLYEDNVYSEDNGTQASMTLPIFKIFTLIANKLPKHGYLLKIIISKI